MKGPFKKFRRFIRGWLNYFVLKFVLWFTWHIPKDKISVWGKRIGTLMYLLARNQCKRALENPDIAFGNSKSLEKKKQITRAAFQIFITGGLELLVYNSISDDDKRQLIQIEGRSYLDEALAKGKGVIGLSAHFGNFPIMGGRLALEGYQCNLVVKAMKDPQVEVLFQKLRRDYGFNTIYLRPPTQCAHACLNALRNNQILLLLGDQRFRKGGVMVNFFGKPASTAPGSASLALSTGAQVLPMFILRQENQVERFIIEKPVTLVKTGDRKKDIQVNLQIFTDIIESYVSRYPEHWIWNHRRWKSVQNHAAYI